MTELLTQCYQHKCPRGFGPFLSRGIARNLVAGICPSYFAFGTKKIALNVAHFLINPSDFNALSHWAEFLNPLTPNDLYMSRTAPLTSKRCILYIYSTNVGTEYFKHALYSPFFFSSKCSLFHNANFLGSCIIHILYTGCAEIKKK